jgi:thioesterase domain-containing protein
MATAQSDFQPLVLLADLPGAAHTIYFAHSADGGVEYAQLLANEFGAGVRFYGLVARGTDGEQAPYETYEEEAADLLEHIYARDPGPYILGGYSAGGGIAFEMAQQIVRSGRKVDLVFMFDAVEPGAMSKPLTWGQRLWMLPRTNPYMLLLWPLNRYRYFRDGARRKARAETVGDRVFEAFLRAQTRYIAKPYFGDILVARARRATAYHVRAGETLGWERVVKGKIETHEIDCAHLGMFRPPAVSKVADIVRNSLKRLPGHKRDHSSRKDRAAET